MPGPGPGNAGLALGAVSGLRVGSRCLTQAAGLRDMLGGRQQLRDESRGGSRGLPAGRCPFRPLRDRHQRDAARTCVGGAAVLYRLVFLTAL